MSISGPREALVEQVEAVVPEVDDKGLLDMPATLVDVFVRSKAVNGKTLREIADLPETRGIYLRKITRNMVEIPVLPETEILRGDILTIGGSTRHVDAAVAAAGPRRPAGRVHRPRGRVRRHRDRRADRRAHLRRGRRARSASRPRAARCSPGLVLGYLRTIHPTFGNIPGPALWLMNTLGLNVFIAIVGISAGPGFVSGLQQVGLSLFLWGMVATTIPLVVAVLLGHYVFKFHPAILFGVCAGVRTTTAALGMIQEAAKSKVPALGYGMPYAIGNTLLTIFGMVIVLMLAGGS